MEQEQAPTFDTLTKGDTLIYVSDNEEEEVTFDRHAEIPMPDYSFSGSPRNRKRGAWVKRANGEEILAHERDLRLP